MHWAACVLNLQAPNLGPMELNFNIAQFNEIRASMWEPHGAPSPPPLVL